MKYVVKIGNDYIYAIELAKLINGIVETINSDLFVV